MPNLVRGGPTTPDEWSATSLPLCSFTAHRCGATLRQAPEKCGSRLV